MASPVKDETEVKADLKKTLREYIAQKKLEKSSDDDKGKVEKEEMEEFTRLYKQWVGDKKSQIPFIFRRVPSEKEPLLLKLREEARAIQLQRRSQELLDHEDLQKLWVLLDRHRSPPFKGDEQLINYEDFLRVSSVAGPRCKPYFRASVFSKLRQNDPYGRLSILQFFNYVMRKVWFHQTRIGLSLYDVAGQGFLRETDFENYIQELIPTLPKLNVLEKSFHNFYNCTAARKFFFFLDPLRTGRLKIEDVMACGFLDDLLDLRDEDLSQEKEEANWFSAPAALRVYGQYLNLDKDRNGMLCKQELARYGTGTLSNVFMDRLFEECMTYEGEMDYKTYLDFVLAMENRREPPALRYLFRILDVQHRGYLNVYALNYFFKAIQAMMRRQGQEPVPFEDVKDEIFDMVKPADPLKITLQDLINCGKGDTFVGILTDLNDFWLYENRECLVADQNDQDQS